MHNWKWKFFAASMILYFSIALLLFSYATIPLFKRFDNIDLLGFIFTVTLIEFIAIVRIVKNAFVNPINIIKHGIKRVTKGDYSHAIEVTGKDEIAKLAIKFNDMQAQLLKRDRTIINTLETAKKEIEAQAKNLVISNEKKINDAVLVANNQYLAAQEANKQIMESVRYAKIIQSSLMPDMNIFKEQLPKSFVLWSPRDVVGGDIFHFYAIQNSFIEKEDGLLSLESGMIICVIDCTGHGVPGALMTMLASSGLRRIIRDEGCLDPGEILSRLNVMVKTTLKQDSEQTLSDDGMDAAICYIKPEEKRLLFSGAKLPLAIIYKGESILVKGDKESIGYKRSDINFQFSTYEVDLLDGMRFYMYTDGYVDQIGGDKGFPLGNANLKKLFQQMENVTFDQQGEILMKHYNDYKGKNESLDDITVIGFEVDVKSSL